MEQTIKQRPLPTRSMGDPGGALWANKRSIDLIGFHYPNKVEARKIKLVLLGFTYISSKKKNSSEFTYSNKEILEHSSLSSKKDVCFGITALELLELIQQFSQFRSTGGRTFNKVRLLKAKISTSSPATPFHGRNRGAVPRAEQGGRSTGGTGNTKSKETRARFKETNSKPVGGGAAAPEVQGRKVPGEEGGRVEYTKNLGPGAAGGISPNETEEEMGKVRDGFREQRKLDHAKLLESEAFNKFSEEFEKATGKKYIPVNVEKNLKAADYVDAQKLTGFKWQFVLETFFDKESWPMRKRECLTLIWLGANLEKYLPTKKDLETVPLSKDPRRDYYDHWDPRHPDYLPGADYSAALANYRITNRKEWVPKPDFEIEQKNV